MERNWLAQFNWAASPLGTVVMKMIRSPRVATAEDDADVFDDIVRPPASVPRPAAAGGGGFAGTRNRHQVRTNSEICNSFFRRAAGRSITRTSTFR